MIFILIIICIIVLFQAYIKRRRLPTIKASQEAKKDQQAKDQANGKAQTGKDVGKVISNIMTNASAACYIGQNGLYQTKSQENGKGKAINGHFNGFNSSNGHVNEHLNGNLDKKEL